MTDYEKGKFCDSCQKHVVDFSRYSDEQIVAFIQQSKGNFCGRFKTSQLNRTISHEKYNTFFPLKARFVAGMLAIATLQPVISYASKNRMLEFDVQFDEGTDSLEIKKELPLNSDTYELKGVLVDAKTNEPIPFATVVVVDSSSKDTSGTVADINGNFSIRVNGKCKLNVNSLSYETITVEVTEEELNGKPMLIKMNQVDPGDVYRIGGPMIEIVPFDKHVIKKPSDAEIRHILNNNR